MTGYQGGIVANGQYLPTESGLQAPGGFLDRLTGALDARAQYQGLMRGYGPALRDAGIPVAQPQGFLAQFLNGIGLGGQQPPPPAPMPVATSSTTDTTGAPAPKMSGTGGQGMPTSAASSAGPPNGQSPFMPLFANAISNQESGGRYDAVGPDTGGGNRALGKYQVMASNVGPWTREVLGQQLTPQQFLASPQAQEAVFNGKFGQYLSQTGNPQDAASMWFTGRPYAQGAGRQDQLGTTGNAYVQRFMAALPGGGSAQGGGMPAQASAYAPTSGSDGPSLRPPTPAGQSGANPMPIATSGPTTPQTPQSSMPQGPASGGASAQNIATSPGAVIAPLMANPATRGAGAQAWQMYRQAAANGGAQGGLTLPAGMTPDALATMISTPQTMQMGLAIWQKALFPQIQAFGPNQAIFRGTQYVGQAPSAPMDVAPGNTVVNPNTGQTIAAVPPDLQHAEVGRDGYGQPQYGAFNPRGGAVTPFQGGQGQGTGAAVDANGQPLTGDAFLKTLPPALGGQVKAIAEGRLKLPTGMGAGNPMAQRLRMAVVQYDPSFDQAGVDARFETRKDFASGDAAKTVTAGNTALIHLGELSALADKLGNADTSIPGNNLWNAAKNYANASSAAGAPLAAFNATASKYVEEATKFYRGTGGAEGDIKRDMLNVSPDMSPSQLKAAIQAQVPLLQGKIAAMQSRWHQGMGPNAGDYPIMSPQAQAVLDRLGPAAAPASGAPSAGLPVAAPASGGGGGAPASGGMAPLDQARAAIARGAPRAAVIQRLQKMGVDPAGL